LDNFHTTTEGKWQTDKEHKIGQSDEQMAAEAKAFFGRVLGITVLLSFLEIHLFSLGTKRNKFRDQTANNTTGLIKNLLLL
jgi:hypothetical protein